jgi:hypothetical protein
VNSTSVTATATFIIRGGGSRAEWPW